MIFSRLTTLWRAEKP